MKRALAVFLALGALAGAGPGSAGASGLVPELLTQFGETGSAAGKTQNPRGIATDPNTGHVFVADLGNSRISEFTAWGNFVKAWGWGVVKSGPGNKPQNEIQEVSVDATGGSFRLLYFNEFQNQVSTEPIAFNASAASVQAAFTELPGAAVAGPAAGPWTIEFTGGMADADIPQLEVTGSTLSGGTATATVKTVQNGANFEICIPANGDACRPGQRGSVFGHPSGLVGQLDSPQGIAVDSNGYVYVVDLSNYRVQKFDSAGHFLLMVGGGVDKGPNHPGNLCTAKFIEEGDTCGPGSTGTANGQFSASWPVASHLSAGPEDVIYVGDKERIQKFNPDGTYKSQISLPGEGTVSSLAVAPSGNVFYSTHILGTSTAPADVHQLSPAGVPICTIEVGNPSALASDADGNAYVFANGVFETPEFNTSEIREYNSGCEPITAFADHEFGPPTMPSSLASTGIGTNALGDVYASNFSFENSYIRAYGPGPIAFEPPPPADPAIGTQYAAAVGTDRATLRAEINPRFWPDATYYVQYGEEECAKGGCASSAPASLTQNSVNAPVTSAPLELSGLKVATTYHYRFVAESGGGGPVFGADRTFHTYADAAAALPDGRVDEMVSPPNKEGAEVAVPTPAGGGADTVQPQQASISGEAITYASFTSFGDHPESAPGASQYLSTRSASGWSTDNINPRFEEGFLSDPLVGFSSDLSHGVVIALEPELTADAAIDVPNIYQRDNLSGVLRAITTEAHHPQIKAPSYCLFYGGTSADSSRVFFGARGGLLEGDPVGDGFNLYEWSAAEGLRLVSVLPAAAEGPASSSFGQQLSGGCIPKNTLMRHAISADGSRVFWTYAGIYNGIKTPLFARINGSETIQLDAPNAGVSGKGGEGRYWDAGVEGSRVFFTATKKLTTQPTIAGSAGKSDLYLYDFGEEEGERLTNLTPQTPEAANVQGVIGASADGSFVYFVAQGVLSATANAGGKTASPGKSNLYAWHEGEGVRFLATLAGTGTEEDGSNWSADPELQTARVSPDGRHLAFVSKRSLTGFDNTKVGGLGCHLSDDGGSFGSPQCFEVFLYDYEADALSCPSCNAAGSRPLGTASLPTWSTPYEQPRYLSDDGQRLLFQSFDALDPHDVNEKQDVYQFERPGKGDCTVQRPTYNPASDGCVSLISSGTSDDQSYFLDASTSGDDAFFSTRQGLVPVDGDGRYDVYDARVGGAPPVPPVPECEGEACRGARTSAPVPSPAGTGVLEGPDDPIAKRGCPKGRREVKAHGKARCVRKARHHKQAGHKPRRSR